MSTEEDENLRRNVAKTFNGMKCERSRNASFISEAHPAFLRRIKSNQILVSGCPISGMYAEKARAGNKTNAAARLYFLNYHLASLRPAADRTDSTPFLG
jgi:hypothetical protein